MEGAGTESPWQLEVPVGGKTLLQVEEHHFSFISMGQHAEHGNPHHALSSGIPRGDEKRYSRLVVKTFIPV